MKWEALTKKPRDLLDEEERTGEGAAFPGSPRSRGFDTVCRRTQRGCRQSVILDFAVEHLAAERRESDDVRAIADERAFEPAPPLDDQRHPAQSRPDRARGASTVVSGG